MHSHFCHCLTTKSVSQECICQRKVRLMDLWIRFLTTSNSFLYLGKNSFQSLLLLIILIKEKFFSNSLLHIIDLNIFKIITLCVVYQICKRFQFNQFSFQIHFNWFQCHHISFINIFKSSFEQLQLFLDICFDFIYENIWSNIIDNSF